MPRLGLYRRGKLIFTPAKKTGLTRADVELIRAALPVAALDLLDQKNNEEKQEALPHQKPPPGDWRWWMILGGRGSGKTYAGARFCLEHLRELGPKARVGIGAETIDDSAETCALGPSGLITMAPGEFQYNKSKRIARHINGGYVRFLGAEKPGRWNGPNWTLLWADELALWQYMDSWDQAVFGLRLPPNPRAIITTTPKNKKWIRELADKPYVVVTKATTYDNPHLAPEALEIFTDRYEGTRIGRQELLAEFLEDVEGALWKRDDILYQAMLASNPSTYTCVAIDPAATGTARSAETGLAVARLGTDNNIYVSASEGVRGSPKEWSAAAYALYKKYNAVEFVIETNQGGDMAVETLRNALPGAAFKIRRIHATIGKLPRAEPVHALYEQKIVFHERPFTMLEDQMCSFPVEIELLDRLDAMVYAITACNARRKLLSSGKMDGLGSTLKGLTGESGWNIK